MCIMLIVEYYIGFVLGWRVQENLGLLVEIADVDLRKQKEESEKGSR